ncbi:MAG: GAF domain-containing protein [Candidatus Rokubacteria bacterium]|nr:GAF domain-containing protein [Candidatus Rokubacteria bacterium]
MLQKTSFAHLPHVQAALSATTAGEVPPRAIDAQGREVLAAYSIIMPLRWAVFVEQPIEEALVPLQASITRTIVLILLGVAASLIASVVLARRMVRPIHTLQEGAARIGAGELAHRLDVRTGDELQALAAQFNEMTGRLQESYATLERRVEERTRELSETLEQQTATAEILRVISSSPTDTRPVFTTILENATRLCDANIAALFLYDGEVLQAAAHHNATAEFAEHLSRSRLRPSHETTTRLAALERRTVHVHDLLNDPAFAPPSVHLRESVRTVLSVPMLREGGLVGVITTWRREVRPFTDAQLALVQTFADQAVIAIENVRLFTELQEKNRAITEALQQQTATSEILRVISSSPTDVQPVFDTITRSAVKLCDAASSIVTTYDGERIHLSAVSNLSPVGLEALRRNFPVRPGRETGASRAILERAVIQIPDTRADAELVLRDAADAAQYRSVLVVPMLRDGKPIGTVNVHKSEAGPFSDDHVQLLKTFADQAVIAIENVRLFTELQEKNRAVTEALEQQTGTAEILRVISSSPTDVQPIFQTIVESAVRLCEADFSGVVRFDGQHLWPGAAHNVTPAELDVMARMFPLAPDQAGAIGQAVTAKRVVQIEDFLALHDPQREAEYVFAQAQPRLGFRTVLVVPMLREGSAVGAILVWRRHVRAFTAKQVQLLQTFADQAVIAIENVRLFTELQEKNRAVTEALEQQTATAEILRVISGSPTDVQPVFESIAASAARLCGANFGGVMRLGADGVRLVAGYNMTDEQRASFDRFYPYQPARDTAVGIALLDCRVVHIRDVLDEPANPIREATRRALGYRTFLAVPMLREGVGVGVIVVWRHEAAAFSDAQIELLRTFADQAVIAIENVRLFTELQERTRDLARSVDQLTALSDVSRAVSSTLDLDRVLNTVVSRASQLAAADGCSIYEYDEQVEGFRVRATQQIAAEVLETQRASILHVGEGVVGRLMETRAPVQVPDITLERAYQSPLRDALVSGGYRSLLAVPMIQEDRVVGGLVVSRRVPGEFAAETVDLMQTFANQSALAIQNARLFREIQEQSRQLEVANRHKSEFLANMSHELRTPLNAVIGFSEVLIEKMFGDINEKQDEYLRDIHSSGRHLLSLINDILDLAKIEAGRMELEVTRFDLPQAIENAMTLVRGRADAHAIRLEADIDQRLGEFAGDERKFKQILLNLLSNAVKFTSEGGRVSLRAGLTNGTIEVAVTDTGIGIAPEDQQTVFEEFRQVGTDYARKREGTGLGLALTKRFVELHGGAIWLKSAPGEGSTFTFTLPVRPWPTSSS